MLTVQFVPASVDVNLPVLLLGVHTRTADVAVDMLADQAPIGWLTMVSSLAT